MSMQLDIDDEEDYFFTLRIRLRLTGRLGAWGGVAAKQEVR